MQGMPKTKTTTIVIPPAVKAAAAKWCEANGTMMSETIIAALCNHIGRPDLIESTRKRGRPKKAVKRARRTTK